MNDKTKNVLTTSARLLSGTAGLSLMIGTCIADFDNKFRKIDGDGISPTRSAIAYLLKVDTRKLCDPHPNRELSLLEKFSYKSYAYPPLLDCYQDQVSSMDKNAPTADKEWHEAMTLRERIAVRFGHISAAIIGVSLVGLSRSKFRFRKRKDDTKE